MHGHGDKPFHCTYVLCDRSKEGNGFPRHWNLRDHMRRVHSDAGSVSPPPQSTGPTRGKNKRKADTEVEKPAKRIATPPAPVRQVSSLLDHYAQSERQLLEVVTKLHDPRNKENLSLLQNAMNCLEVMAQTSQRINAAPQMPAE